ncbi:MAG: response regulator [Dongiaceae bacterium]
MTAKTGRILIVDDEPDDVATIERAGTALMLEVATLDHTGAFERLIADWAPDVVVLDVGIPDRDGYALLGVLASLKFAGDVVMISGMPQQDLDTAAQVGRMRGLHIIGTARKPIVYNAIHSLIARAEAAE